MNALLYKIFIKQYVCVVNLDMLFQLSDRPFFLLGGGWEQEAEKKGWGVGRGRRGEWRRRKGATGERGGEREGRINILRGREAGTEGIREGGKGKKAKASKATTCSGVSHGSDLKCSGGSDYWGVIYIFLHPFVTLRSFFNIPLRLSGWHFKLLLSPFLLFTFLHVCILQFVFEGRIDLLIAPS